MGHFFAGFGALWVPLGSLLGPLEALLGGLWTQKTLKNQQLFKVFENAAFWLFEALDGPLGLILPPSWADLVRKWAQNGLQKVIQQITSKLTKKVHNLGSKMRPKMG